MESKGISTDKGELNRWIKATNRMLLDVRKKIKSLFSWIAEVKGELSKPKSNSLVDLLTDYYSMRNAAAYSQRGKVINLKDYADTINYLRDNRLLTLETLQSRLSSLESSFDTLTGSMKAKSIRMKDLHELLRQGENYFRLKPVHEELNRIKWKRQRERFKADHDSDLRLFYAARRILREKLGDKPVALQEWNREFLRLESEYADRRYFD